MTDMTDRGRRAVPHSAHWGAFTAEVVDGRLVGVQPFARDPDPSPILRSIPDAVQGAARVQRPSIRRGWLDAHERAAPQDNRRGRGAEPFVEVPWDETLDIVAAELDRVRRDHGNEAIFGGSYGWSSAGRFHHAKTQLQRFLNTIGGYTGQVHTYSIAAGYAILPHVIGEAAIAMSGATSWTSIVRDCNLFVAFGGVPAKNLQVSSGGLGEHVSHGFLKQAAASGVAFVNVSPVRGDTDAAVGAEWLALRPNTDTALMLGLAHALETEDLVDRGFLASHCVGYEQFRAYLVGDTDGVAKDVDWAAAICGIDAATIRTLARRMAAGRTMLSTNWSLQRADHGEQPFWMTVTLAAMLGQVGLPGGGFAFGYGSMGGNGTPRVDVSSPAISAGRKACDSWIPVARIADLLLNPGGGYEFDGEHRVYPDTRLVYWSGGNPFHHHQDLNRLVEAWRQPETIIVNEPWWTATAKFSDIVLPTTTTLERNDIGASSRDRYILAMHKAIAPIGEARHDFDVFAALAARFGTVDAFTEGRDEAAWLRHLYDRARQQAAEKSVTLPAYDDFWTAGYAEIPAPDEPHIAFAGFRADPAAHPLKTPSGRIEVFSATVDCFGYDDCPGHAVWREPEEWLGGAAANRFPLHLVSNQPTTRLHSQMDSGIVSRETKITGREPIWLHPDDAAARDLADGDLVCVFNDRGALLAGVRVTDGLLPGVVMLPTGAWYDPADPATPGSIDKHGNPNVLTIDRGTSRLGQGPIAHTVLVEIEKFSGEPPPVTAFYPPAFVDRS
jgi:biotin/methionine sulfoxide reductase